ncbi:putative condensin subunit 1/Condensin-2 complex subunit D3 [Lupinus albus]|uniref:Putative condensin subunit 1/Condensin-2 complex subunit D3 n=1 Tax=Lupinus albus TaxID=3870 RepID=A0A6A4QDW3_LUPAL|nr:putative condensin subunit 1/Condensin-2 complex subunit D3 [Lupinus albus]
MYARLKDPCASVRKDAVLVLSHLILNDMMKVKGYINEMAMRLEDEDERISNLAKLFFLNSPSKETIQYIICFQIYSANYPSRT